MLMRIVLTAALCGVSSGCGNELSPPQRVSESTSANGKSSDSAAKEWNPEYDEEPELQPFDWNDSNASASEIERRVLAQLGCNVEVQPVSLARWLLKNRVVRSVGPGGDGHAILVPRKPLYVLGMQVSTIEGWGTVSTIDGSEVTAHGDTPGQLDAVWPFAMNAGGKTWSVSVTFDAEFAKVKAAANKAVPCAYVSDDRLKRDRASSASGTVTVGHTN